MVIKRSVFNKSHDSDAAHYLDGILSNTNYITVHHISCSLQSVQLTASGSPTGLSVLFSYVWAFSSDCVGVSIQDK